MKICHYNAGEAGAVVGDRVYSIGEALVSSGHLKTGYTMLEVITALANVPDAMKCVQDGVRAGNAVPLASVQLLAPILTSPSLGAAAANYKDHQAEMKVKTGHSYEDLTLAKDDLMAEFFLKPTSYIIGAGGTAVPPKTSQD